MPALNLAPVRSGWLRFAAAGRALRAALRRRFGLGFQWLRGRVSPLVARLQPLRAKAQPLIAPIARRWKVVARTFSAVSRFGWGAIVVGLLGLVVGRWQGWAELVALGIGCLTLSALATLWTLGRNAFEVAIELTNNRVRVGDPAVARLVVRQNANRPSLPARMELPVGAGLAVFHVPSLRRDREHEEIFTIPTRRRAVVTLGPARSVRGDALGLMRREQEWTKPVELYVHPRTVPLQSSVIGFLKDVEGVTTQDLSSNDVSFHALREYVPGDDQRNVHWRSTARTGKLMVRQFEETRRAHLLLILSLADSDYTDPDEFETAISIVGSLAVQALRDEREVSVVTQHGALRFSGGAHLLDQLAGLEQIVTNGRTGSQITQLVSEAVSLVPQASVVSIVAGSRVEAAALRQSELGIPLSALRFAVRCEVGVLVTRRSLGSLLVLSLADVDDLPLALRAVQR